MWLILSEAVSYTHLMFYKILSDKDRLFRLQVIEAKFFLGHKREIELNIRRRIGIDFESELNRDNIIGCKEWNTLHRGIVVF